MSSIGLIINVKSNRNASMADDLLNVAKHGGKKSHQSQIRIAVLDGIEGLGNALDEMNRHKVSTLILAGGDGTMQAVFTDMINNKRFENRPQFVLLPCGMTNVIAKDCGLPGGPVKSLDQFLWRQARGDVTCDTRDLIKTSIYGQDPIFGFFVGAAGFHSAVQYSRSTIQTKGAKRSLALIASVTSFITKAAFDRERSIENIDLEFLSGNAPGTPLQEKQSLFMATTLKKLGSGLYPFWGQGDGAMQVTTVTHPAKYLLRAAPFITKGKPLHWFKKRGIRSWRPNEMHTRFTGPIVFDGEIFQCDGQHTTSFETKEHIKFLY